MFVKCVVNNITEAPLRLSGGGVVIVIEYAKGMRKAFPNLETKTIDGKTELVRKATGYELVKDGEYGGS